MDKFCETSEFSAPTGKAVTLDGDLRLLVTGDGEAFERIYAATRRAVFGFALSILKNRHDAEDVMHDVYVSVFNAAAAYKPGGKPMAWILKITKNLCLKSIRAGKRKSFDSETELQNMLAEDSALSVDEKMFMAEVMESLSDTEREIVVLHAVSGFKHREIADVLDLPLPTVLSKYNRALEKLRKKIR